MWRESVNPRTKRVPARKSRGNGSLLLDFLPAPCLHPSSPLVALPPTLPQPIYLAFITLKARNAHLESSIDKLSVRYIYMYVCTYFPIVKFVFYFLLTFSFFFFSNSIHEYRKFNPIVSRRIRGACRLLVSLESNGGEV